MPWSVCVAVFGGVTSRKYIFEMKFYTCDKLIEISKRTKKKETNTLYISHKLNWPYYGRLHVVSRARTCGRLGTQTPADELVLFGFFANVNNVVSAVTNGP